VVDPLLQAGDLETVNQVLYALRLLCLPDYARAFHNHAEVTGLFKALATPARLEMLHLALTENALIGGPGALFAYMSLQLQEHLPTWIAWSGRLQDDHLRKATLDGLIVAAQGQTHSFEEAVKSSTPKLVADILQGMGRVGDLHCLEVILGAFAHADAGVRVEVLVAVRSFETPRVREVVLRAMQDSDESVRLAAFRHVAVHRDKSGGRRLEELVGSKAFRDRSFPEKRAACMALAHIQGKDALPILTESFKARRRTEVARAAAHGLGVLGGPDIRRLLEPVAREGTSELAIECRQVLAGMKG
jgi:hypothetical protein